MKSINHKRASIGLMANYSEVFGGLQSRASSSTALSLNGFETGFQRQHWFYSPRGRSDSSCVTSRVFLAERLLRVAIISFVFLWRWMLPRTAARYSQMYPSSSCSGLVPKLQSTPQEAREPQPHLQHPHDLAAVQPALAAQPDPRRAAVHSVRRPGGINALCTTLLHRQWAPAVSWP